MSHRKDSVPLCGWLVWTKTANAQQLALQLSTLPGVELTNTCSRTYAGRPSSCWAFPLVVTTLANHRNCWPDGERREKVLCVAGSEPGTLIALARLPLDSASGSIVARSASGKSCCGNSPWCPASMSPPSKTSGRVSAALKDLLQGLDVLLVAPDYLTYADDQSGTLMLRETGRPVDSHRHRLDQELPHGVGAKILELQG